jgi:hypothetical protein
MAMTAASATTKMAQNAGVMDPRVAGAFAVVEAGVDMNIASVVKLPVTQALVSKLVLERMRQ